MGAACCCVSLLEPPTAKPSVCVARACLNWANQSIAATSILKYPSYSPSISTASSAASSKPSPILSATQVRKQRRGPGGGKGKKQNKPIVLLGKRAPPPPYQQKMSATWPGCVLKKKRRQGRGRW